MLVKTRTEKDVGFPRTGIIRGCRLPNMDAGNQILVLCKYSEHLGRTFSLHHPQYIYIKDLSSAYSCHWKKEREIKDLLMFQVMSKCLQKCLHR